MPSAPWPKGESPCAHRPELAAKWSQKATPMPHTTFEKENTPSEAHVREKDQFLRRLEQLLQRTLGTGEGGGGAAEGAQTGKQQRAGRSAAADIKVVPFGSFEKADQSISN